MAAITPWIGQLLESELDNVIAWKSIVKTEPDANEEDVAPRFSDDGSNLRSFVGSPPLSSDSMIQLLQKPGLSARAKIPVSDGDVSVPVVLSDAAWDAYDKGIAEERGDEPRKGDLLVCKRMVIVSTPWGPPEERISFRIEELEYAGNIRITIGKPTSLLQRASIVALRQKIESLALKQHVIDEVEECSDDDNNDNEDEEIEEQEAVAAPLAAAAASAPGETGLSASADVEHELTIDTAAEVLPDAVPTPSIRPENPEEQAVAGASTPLRTLISPIVSRSSAGPQIESQLQVEATQTQLPPPPPPPRNPNRRGRGGYSMGREGFETARGDNLTGPQAPTLHQRQGVAAAAEPAKKKLLDVILKVPGQPPRNRTPELSAPVSAQREVIAAEVVVETPAKRKRACSPATTAAQDAAPETNKRSRIPDEQPVTDSQPAYSPPEPAQQPSHAVGDNKGKRRRPESVSLGSEYLPRKVYRIAQDQKAPLDDQSSWLPPAPGHEFPHPNVPVKLLAAWNSKAELGTDSPSQSSPIALIERSSGEKSVEEVQPELEAEADESESAAEESVSEDESIIPWSQSQSRSQALPPDSSAEPSLSAHTKHLGSRDGAMLAHEQAPTSMPDPCDSRGEVTQSGSNQRNSPKKAHSIASQGSQEVRVVEQPSSSLRQKANSPADSSRSQATPAISQSTNTKEANQRGSQQKCPLPQASGANARPVRPKDQRRSATTTPAASQPIPTGPRNMAPLADNNRGPLQASTQQTHNRRYRPAEPRLGSSFTTSSGVPTGPRASRDSRYSLPNCRGSSSKSTPEPKAPPYGGFYIPLPSGYRRDTLPAQASKHEPAKMQTPTQGGTQAPNGTQASEMEMSVPRSLPPSLPPSEPSEHRQQRRGYMRDAQRRHWLQTTFSADGEAAALSTTRLYRLYSKQYPSDPVTGRDFVILVTELRPAADGESGSESALADVERNAAPARIVTEEPARNARNGHVGIQQETRDDSRDRNAGPPANFKFLEFVSGWKNIRPGGAFAIHSAATGAPTRKLNVLDWGFGE